MNKFWKRWMTLLLCGCMILSSLAGCGNTEEDSSSSSSQEEQSAADSQAEASQAESQGEDSQGTELLDPIENTGELVLPRSQYVTYPVENADVTLEYWATLHGNISNNPDTPTANETAWAQYWQEDTGISVHFTHPTSGSEDAEFGVLIVSGTLPDIIEWSWTSYTGGVVAAEQEGVVTYLDSYITSDGAAADLWQFLQDNPNIDREVKTDEGHYYCFPFIRGDEILQTTSGLFLRSDMLAEAGLEVPETIAEWTEVLQAFKDQGATKPYVSSNIAGLKAAFLGAYEVRNNMYVQYGTQDIAFGAQQDGYRDWLAQMNAWYEAGLLDPDIQTADGTVQRNAILMGEAGATYGSGGGNMGSWWTAAESEPETYGEDFGFVGARFPVLNEGDPNHYSGGQYEYATGSTGSAAISLDCQDPELAVKFLNYLYTEAGHLMINFGREGESYTMVDGEPTYTDVVMNNPDGLSSSVMMSYYGRGNANGPFVQDPGYILQYYAKQEQRDALELWSWGDNPRQTLIPPVSLTVEESNEYAALSTQVTTLVDEMTIQFLTGEADLDTEWETFQSQLEQIGIERMLEIYQAALDRYNAR